MNMKNMWLLAAVMSAVFAAVFLGEAFTWKTVVGSILLLAGTLVMVL